MPEHVRFIQVGKSPSGKTLLWRVDSATYSDPLGSISWHTPWRRYAFAPREYTIYDASCLREISEFCYRQTSLHKEFVRLRKELDVEQD